MFVYIDRLKLPIIYNLFDQWLFKTCGSERERERERESSKCLPMPVRISVRLSMDCATVAIKLIYDNFHVKKNPIRPLCLHVSATIITY